MKQVFFSYSHADEIIRNKLQKHLSLLVRQGKIETWYDRDIDVGKNLDKAIIEKLEDSDIILLLISPDFIYSEYCYDVEMTIAMARHEKGEAIVVPIIARPCDWHEAPFGRLNGCPKDGHAISLWDNEDLALLNVVQSLKRIV